LERASKSNKIPILKMGVEGSLRLTEKGIKEANRILIIPPN